MNKKVVITLDEPTFESLSRLVGEKQVPTYIENLLKPRPSIGELDAAYSEMARDEDREAEAMEWAEATGGDVSDEAW